ncbi:MAG TPA: peptide ligase PGM1-related protein [Kribbellaceae bacterium]|nr:peptide ligase PGM1-related protein [Kribbellaceae bacterium]
MPADPPGAIPLAVGPAEVAFRQARPDLDLFRPAGTLVVLPSHSIPPGELGEIKGYHRYQERLLFLLLALRRPEVSVVFLSGFPIGEAIVDYYLGLLPDPAGARRRLCMLPVGGPGDDQRPLARRILDHPALCRRIAAAAGPDAWLVPFVVGTDEERLAAVTGLPLYGTAASLAHLGTKSGARRLAARAGVETVPGVGGLHGPDEVRETAWRLSATDPGPVIVKLDDGYGGLGGAIVHGLCPGMPLCEARTDFAMPGETWGSFGAKVAERGAVVERFLTDAGLRSPSALVQISPGGVPDVLAIQDQILDGTVFDGCAYPAHPSHRAAVRAAAGRIALQLAEEGVMGVLSLDFLVVPGRRPRVLLCEINLRLGGTTHPFGAALLASGAERAPGTDRLVRAGAGTHYVSTDTFESLALRGSSPADLVARLGDRAFSARTRTGVVLHMLGAAAEFGKVGFTAIGDSANEAWDLYEATRTALSPAPCWRENTDDQRGGALRL